MKSLKSAPKSLRKSLQEMAVEAANRAVAEQEQLWTWEVGLRFRQQVIAEADSIIGNDYDDDSILALCDIATEAFDARCDEIYWASRSPASGGLQ